MKVALIGFGYWGKIIYKNAFLLSKPYNPFVKDALE